MMDDCPGNFRVFNVQHVRRSLVEMHKTLCTISDCEHDHEDYAICSMNPWVFLACQERYLEVDG